MIPQASFPVARLADLGRRGPLHLRPIYAAMASAGIGLFLVRQRSEAFDLRYGRPFVALVGDDTDVALGPDGFHRASLERLARLVGGISVIASGVVPDVYATAAGCAVLGQSGLIVETRPEQEGAWMDLLSRAAPRTPLLLCTPIEGTA